MEPIGIQSMAIHPATESLGKERYMPVRAVDKLGSQSINWVSARARLSPGGTLSLHTRITLFTMYIKWYVIISIATVCVLILILLTQTAAQPNSKEIRALQDQQTVVRSRSTQTRKLETSKKFQKSDFYQTIIDNNLFRPLGWRPPRPREPYRLIGTILPTDGEPQAIFQTTVGKKLHIVSTGEKLDADTTLTAVEQLQVTLSTKGKHRTLRLSTSRWLR